MAADPYHTAAWLNVRRTILRRDNWQCQVKGPHCKGTASTVDHIISWQDGGAWYDHTNLRAACTTCNYGRRRPIHPAELKQSEPSRAWW